MRSELAEPGTRQLGDFAELLFDDPATGLLMVDEAGWVWRCNAAVLRMTARPRHLLEGWPAFMLVAEDDRGRFRSLCSGDKDGAFAARLQATGLPVRIAHARLTLPDGRPGGRLLRVSEVQAERSRELRLEDGQRLQAVGQLAAGIAHDFSNIVGAVAGAADLLADRPACRDDPACRELLEELRAGARRGRSLIRRLLGSARPDAGGEADDAQDVAVGPAITDLAGMLRRLFPATIRVELDLTQAAGKVRIDPTRLDQILLNLAINARDAMPEGGRLSIRSRDAAVGRGGAAAPPHVRDGHYILVEVADTGVGIAPDILPRVFDRFFTTRYEQGGSGLGLATVRDLVMQAGGFIDVRSRVGRGTTMLVYLPRAPARQDAPPPPPPSRRGTVLLVEDEAIVRKLAQRALANLGWRVLAAESGEAALALLDGVRAGAGRPTVVVSDLALGDMSGVALVREVRERLAAPGLPAVVTSGFAEGRLAAELATLGPAVRFLPKPYSLPELGAALDRFAHGPPRIAIAPLVVNSAVDEHIMNAEGEPGTSSVAAHVPDVTDSGGGA